MASFFPTYEQIQNLKVQPEPGELYILNFLKNTLDDTFEVYFNPYLNGDRPDIIIMRKDYGIMVIEVKDWGLNSYELNERKKWKLKKNGAIVKSPIDQVLQYKENMYNLHIENLLERKIKNFKYLSVVKCALYFHNETQQSVYNFLVSPFSEEKSYQSFLKWNISLLGRDDLLEDKFLKILKDNYLIASNPSIYFDNDLYVSLKRYLQPTMHMKEEGEFIKYNTEQERLVVSEAREQRIKGVVGSGKTTVMAARAVNAHIRTGEEVLLLCFNITLKNYIHDKVSKIRADFGWKNFHILNYHTFITAEMNNSSISFSIPANFDSFTIEEKSNFFEKNYYCNENLFEENKDKLKKYKTILIDEVQDYKIPWMSIIKKYFLEEQGEYLLLGDVKQNIYFNETENKDVKSNVRGRPSELKVSIRSNNEIKDIAINFQKTYFENKYDLDDFNKTKQGSFKFGATPLIKYIYTNQKDIEHSELLDTITSIAKELNEQPNDIVILGIRVAIMREFDCYYRCKTNEKTNTMFETQEVWYKLLLQTFRSQEVINKGLKLFPYIKDMDIKQIKLAVLLALKDLSECNDTDVTLLNAYNRAIINSKVDKNAFENWYSEEKLTELLNRDKKMSIKSLERQYPDYRDLTKQLKIVRDNKKFHFWYNSGTIKLSTIHSFKGWEANTVFLLLEDEFIGGDFASSFEELIYTGLTRAKTNLIIINYGNMKYHNSMEKLLEKV